MRHGRNSLFFIITANGRPCSFVLFAHIGKSAILLQSPDGAFVSVYEISMCGICLTNTEKELWSCLCSLNPDLFGVPDFKSVINPFRISFMDVH